MCPGRRRLLCLPSMPSFASALVRLMKPVDRVVVRDEGSDDLTPVR